MEFSAFSIYNFLSLSKLKNSNNVFLQQNTPQIPKHGPSRTFIPSSPSSIFKFLPSQSSQSLGCSSRLSPRLKLYLFSAHKTGCVNVPSFSLFEGFCLWGVVSQQQSPPFLGKMRVRNPPSKQNYSQDSDVGARNTFVFFLPPLSSYPFPNWSSACVVPSFRRTRRQRDAPLGQERGVPHLPACRGW